MEQTKGYVYAMINPSYKDLVKIGKTTKDPEDRAKELSSATGVATPFIVVYKRFFNNCSVAEKRVHSILTEQGYRVNDSREFFSVSIPDAINIILNIGNTMREKSKGENIMPIEYKENEQLPWEDDGKSSKKIRLNLPHSPLLYIWVIVSLVIITILFGISILAANSVVSYSEPSVVGIEQIDNFCVFDLLRRISRIDDLIIAQLFCQNACAYHGGLFLARVRILGNGCNLGSGFFRRLLFVARHH
mgnify:CR=1 FL=1